MSVVRENDVTHRKAYN
uniref:Uncharacterized protein n=1 Tax=Lepeophtheirus salmonis TaxID=72036 RepID=A0A0K2VKZ9_LEPSM